jgi:hypothetical protein
MSSMSTRSKSKGTAAADHAAFLGMLPCIHRYAQFTFRKVRSELRDDLIQEVIVNCFVAYARLVELNKESRAFPSALARFAVAQVRTGRRVGTRLRIRDLLSPYAQRQKEFRVDRLDHFDAQENCWREIVLEDKRATPAEIAACRLDFSAWLRLLPRRQRKIALALAMGETTSAAAKMFGVSAARVSQYRQWLKESWSAFQGEGEPLKPLSRRVA